MAHLKSIAKATHMHHNHTSKPERTLNDSFGFTSYIAKLTEIVTDSVYHVYFWLFLKKRFFYAIPYYHIIIIVIGGGQM